MATNESGSSRPKKPAPSDDDDIFFDDIFFSDFMELDCDPLKDVCSTESKPVSIRTHSNEYTSTHSNEPTSTSRQQESVITSPTSTGHSRMNPLPFTNASNCTPLLFKAPSSRARATSTKYTSHSKSILSTPTNRLCTSAVTTPRATSSTSAVTTPRATSSTSAVTTPRATSSTSAVTTPRATSSTSAVTTPRTTSSTSAVTTPRAISSNQFSTPRAVNHSHSMGTTRQFTTPTVQASQSISTSQQRFSTPSNAHTASHSSTTTPSCFRTPSSRLPAAIVCTPGDAPLIMKTPHSARRRFPGPAGLLPALVSHLYEPINNKLYKEKILFIHVVGYATHPTILECL